MVDFGDFVALHKPQLESSGVPHHLWQSLFKKLSEQIFDAGDKFSIFLVDYGDEERGEDDPQYRVLVSTVEGIDAYDPDQVYLIDHAWTFRAHEVKLHLKQVPALLGRMAKLTHCNEDLPESELIDEVCKQMWKYSQTYTIGHGQSVEDRMPIWYIMDEFGSSIQHSDDPSFRVVPLVHIPEQVTYSVLFPVRNVVHNEEVTRNFIEGCLSNDEETKRALMLPWFASDFKNLSFEQEEPDEQYFLEGHIKESLPDLQALKPYHPDQGRTFRVYADYKYIHEYLKHPWFVMTDNENDADILWYTSHFKAFESLSLSSPQKFVNQFPYENLLTIKDLLCIVCRRKTTKGVQNFDPETLETYPQWLPTTFNLKTELPKFVSYFQRREEKGLDNNWICKPWNLARGLDTHITSNLKYILRLPFSGPKVAQKYISNPVLFERPDIGGKVKFDIRYVILLSSVEPVKAYAYRNFFLRFSNKAFELNDFDDYEKHFTVMNYNETAPLCKMLHYEFISAFEKQYPNHSWKEIENEIFAVLREVLERATFKEPPCGIGHSPQSRALYAADLMLEWRRDPDGIESMQPKLLEINWTPDCRRACEYYPTFYNDIFSLLFLDDEKEVFASL